MESTTRARLSLTGSAERLGTTHGDAGIAKLCNGYPARHSIEDNPEAEIVVQGQAEVRVDRFGYDHLAGIFQPAVADAPGLALAQLPPVVSEARSRFRSVLHWRTSDRVRSDTYASGSSQPSGDR